MRRVKIDFRNLEVTKREFAEFWGLSKGRISQLLKEGILKAEENGRLRARENIEALILWRHRPRRIKSKNLPIGNLEIDLEGVLKEFREEEKNGKR